MDDEKLSEMFEGLLLLYQLIQKKIFKHKSFETRRKISFNLYLILLMLKSSNQLPLSETGKLLCIRKQNMTYMTDKLVEEGLIKRVPDLNDRRMINITITDKGKMYVDEWQKNKLEGMKRNFIYFNDDDLTKLHKSVDNMKYILSKIEND